MSFFSELKERLLEYKEGSGGQKAIFWIIAIFGPLGTLAALGATGLLIYGKVTGKL